MTKIIVSLFIALLIEILSQGQYYFYSIDRLEPPVILEVGVSVGLMNCLTDLGGRPGRGKAFIKDINWKNSKPCGGLYASLLYEHKVGLRLEGVWGKLTGYDSILKGDKSIAEARYHRNLHFRTTITEFALTGELYPLAFLPATRDNSYLLSVYLLAGLGYFSFNPQAKLNTRWVLLNPLHTEGQGFNEHADRPTYKLNQINFSVGLGVNYEMSALHNVRIEIMHRILKTDYLDDVSQEYIEPSLFYSYLDANQADLAVGLAHRKSEINPLSQIIPGEQRGNPRKNDSYFTITLKFGMVLNRSPRR